MSNNFERIKACESEFDMADLVMGWVCNHKAKIWNEDGSFSSLPFLTWLQCNKNIFDEERRE